MNKTKKQNEEAHDMSGVHRISPDEIAKHFGTDVGGDEENPTAENIAQDFLDVKAPFLLRGTGAKLIRCKIEETRKCSATAEISY